MSRRRGWQPIPCDERVYFKVAYTDRRLARSLRCRWDPDCKKWYTTVKSPWLEVLKDVFDVVEVDRQDMWFHEFEEGTKEDGSAEV